MSLNRSQILTAPSPSDYSWLHRRRGRKTGRWSGSLFARLRSNTVRIFFNRKRGVPIDDWPHVYGVRLPFVDPRYPNDAAVEFALGGKVAVWQSLRSEIMVYAALVIFGIGSCRPYRANVGGSIPLADRLGPGFGSSSCRTHSFGDGTVSDQSRTARVAPCGWLGSCPCMSMRSEHW